MNERDFVYWLRGFLELRENNEAGLTAKQVNVIDDHLSEVLKKRTPNRRDGSSSNIFGSSESIRRELDAVLDIPTHLTC